MKFTEEDGPPIPPPRSLHCPVLGRYLPSELFIISGEGRGHAQEIACRHATLYIHFRPQPAPYISRTTGVSRSLTAFSLTEEKLGAWLARYHCIETTSSFMCVSVCVACVAFGP